jgi:16S rRNA (cytidine1402-2'-O)-methyltransferase
VVSYFEGNEQRRTDELLTRCSPEKTSCSSPTRACRACLIGFDWLMLGGCEVPVTGDPRPVAVLVALTISGLPVDRFCFEGFLPRKGGERSRRLAELATEPRTMVFFESPHRTRATLQAMTAAWGADRPAAVCRELTKTYEEVVRGPLAELVAWSSAGVRGEVTLVVSGAPVVSRELGEEEMVELVADLEQHGSSRRDAIAAVARETGARRRAVYDAVHRP